MTSKKEAFAVLDDYPKDGPDMPEREKVQRKKDKHDPGTGRRDREKREGRGPSNWGNPMDDTRQFPEEHDDEEEMAEAPAEKAKTDYVPADQYFSKDDEDGEKITPVKQVVKVPPGYAGVVKAGEGVEIVEEDPSENPNRQLPKPQPKLEKKPKKQPYHPEKETPEHPEEEDIEANQKGGKKPRDQQFKGVQHNRNYAAPPA